MENNAYFKELSRILRKHDIENGPVENGRLIIRMDGQPVGRIEHGAIRYLAPGDLQTPEASEAFQKAVPYAEMVTEYMDGLERAPLLKADGLSSRFYLLADFNGTVLAGKKMDGDYEMQFATWDWDSNRTSLEQGHYYYDNYEGAKADFAERSGLIQKGRQFSDEQLTAIYRCLQDTLDGHYELTDAQEETIRKASKQIEFAVPDLEERIQQEREDYDKFEQTM